MHCIYRQTNYSSFWFALTSPHIPYEVLWLHCANRGRLYGSERRQTNCAFLHCLPAFDRLHQGKHWESNFNSQHSANSNTSRLFGNFKQMIGLDARDRVLGGGGFEYFATPNGNWCRSVPHYNEETGGNGNAQD